MRLAVASASASVASIVAGLLTYEIVALVVSFASLGIACYALWRVDESEQRQQRRQTEVQAELQARAEALGEAISDDLRGD